MEILFSAEGLIALLTLTFLEIVLGVDNIIFISIVSNKLPVHQQSKARNIGIILALIVRIGLLFSITAIMKFKEPLIAFDLLSHSFHFSGRDLILLLGGIFLIGKSTSEIHHKMEGGQHEEGTQKTKNFSTTIVQIVLIDIVFSFDSILTAIGLTEHLIIMIIAVIIALGVMMVFAGRISRFISKHPSLEVLALSFLILIGFMLALEAFHQEVPKGYIYFAVFFSLLVETINMRMQRKKALPVELHKRIKKQQQ